MSTDARNPDRSDPVRAAVRSWSAEARAGEDAHPTSDVLLAYHDLELAEVEAEGVREHLASCAECAQRALDLASLSAQALAEGDAERSEKADEAWQSTRRALAVEGLLRSSGGAPAKRPSWLFADGLFGPRLAWAAAAVLLLTTVGLSLRLADAGRSLSELERVRANVLLIDLHPLAAGGQRADEAPQPEVASAAGEDLVLILHLLDPGLYTRYRVELMDPEGRTMWSTDALERSPEGDFTVLLPRRLLAAGDYRIRLHGMDGERADLLAEYDLRLAAR